MFARLATFCLLNLVVCAWGASNDLPSKELVVYLSADSGVSPRVLDTFKHELGQIMQTAAIDLDWRSTAAKTPSSTAAPLIVVRLEGACSMPPGGAAPAAMEKPECLGSTVFADGQALPFSFVNCASLTRMLAPLLGAEPAMRRDFLYGRAMARVLAHEFYHVLAGASEHAADGMAKSTFTPSDLVSEKFDFEPATLVRLQRKRPASATETAAGDDSTGRN